MNAATLRYYERRGLLPTPARTPSGHRHYDEDAVRFLRAIKEAQAIGFTLAEIEEYLHVARSGPASAALRTRAADNAAAALRPTPRRAPRPVRPA